MRPGRMGGCLAIKRVLLTWGAPRQGWRTLAGLYFSLSLSLRGGRASRSSLR